MLLLLLAISVLGLSEEPCPSPKIYTFNEFLIRFEKSYSANQTVHRKQIFDGNVTKLQNNPCCTCGITKFYDQTWAQIMSDRGLYLPLDIEEQARKQEEQNKESFFKVTASQIKFKVGAASSLDWRDHGVVTPVKIQGTCGTCWSFATVGMCESSLILQGRAFNNRLYQVDLSEQFLLRCTKNSSCGGGYLQTALDKALQSGLPYQTQYPYQPFTYEPGLCSTSNLVMISNMTRKTRYMVDDNVVIQMLQDGPITAAVSASGWEGYSQGIYRCSPRDQIDHAVLLVGYTPEAWIAKNSWGTDFGQNGYIYISRRPGENCKIGMAVHEMGQFVLNLSQMLLALALILMLV